MSARESVSVIVAFAGSERELERLLGVLGRLACSEGDEVIVADNRGRGGPPAGPVKQWKERGGTAAGPVKQWKGRGGTADPAPAPGSPRILAATGTLSPGFARNAGARIATGEWLLFIDADTVPSPALLDDYFDPAPREDTAVLAGGIVDVPSSVDAAESAGPIGRRGPGRGGAREPRGALGGGARASLAARHTVARGQMSQSTTLGRAATPYAQTANCAVRRSAFATAGGFEQEIRAGEDADLCFRLARAGWALEERPRALVTHSSRPTLPALLSQLARHGSGAAWLNRRYPGEFPAPSARELAARARDGAAGLVAALRHGDGEAAWFAILDVLSGSAFDAGRLLSNQARRSV